VLAVLPCEEVAAVLPCEEVLVVLPCEEVLVVLPCGEVLAVLLCEEVAAEVLADGLLPALAPGFMALGSQSLEQTVTIVVFGTFLQSCVGEFANGIK
jgi:hypothetical protein